MHKVWGRSEAKKIGSGASFCPARPRLGSVRFGLLGSAVPGSAQLESPWLHLGWRDSAYPGWFGSGSSLARRGLARLGPVRQKLAFLSGWNSCFSIVNYVVLVRLVRKTRRPKN